MNLYIHFGTNKAGSSYLQYLCAQKRQALIEHGIFFPLSIHFNKMIEGKISPGNGLEFKRVLDQGDLKKTTYILKKWKDDAEIERCNKILISAEGLFSSLGNKTALETLTNSCQNLGIKNINAIGFFRNLVDHSISTYKHRAKSGKHKDFKYWLENQYEYPELLSNLFENKEGCQICFFIRNFKPDSEYLRKAFFNESLRIEFDDWPDKPRVNESVTLSEVLLMQEISRQYPLVSSYFVEALKELPKESKAKDKELEEHYRYHAYQFLKQYEDDVQEWNQFFPYDEKIKVVESFPNTNGYDFNSQMQLTSAQIKVILKLIRSFNTPKGKLIKLRRKVASFLPSIISKRISKLSVQQ